MGKKLVLGAGFRETILVVARGVGYDRVIPIKELRAGWTAIELKAVAVAAELLDAEQRGQPLTTTVRDWSRAPHTSQIHQAFEDVVTLTLPEPLLGWARQLFASPPRELLEDVELGLLAAIADPALSPALRVLAKFYVFECLRLGLVLTDHLAGEHNVLSGGMDIEELDRLAEQELWHALHRPAPSGLRYPTLRSMFVHAALHVEARMRNNLASAAKEAVQRFAEEARREAQLRTMDAGQSALLRAKIDGGGKLDPGFVGRKHAMLFGGVEKGTIATRASRLLASIKTTNAIPTREGRSLVDLVRAMRDGEP